MPALSYDGVDDYVDHGDIAALDALGALTISLWLQVVTLTQNGGPISKCTLGSGTDGFACAYIGASNRFAWGTNGMANYGYVAALVEDVWAHWAVVYDGSQVGNAGRLKIYKDGVAQSLTFVGTIPASYADSTEPLRTGTGRESTGCPEYIAHVKVWAAALTAAEVTREVRAFAPRRTRNLILWSHYGDGTRARDYSGRGNHGTVTGAVTVAGPPGVPFGPRGLLSARGLHTPRGQVSRRYGDPVVQPTGWVNL